MCCPSYACLAARVITCDLQGRVLAQNAMSRTSLGVLGKDDYLDLPGDTLPELKHEYEDLNYLLELFGSQVGLESRVCCILQLVELLQGPGPVPTVAWALWHCLKSAVSLLTGDVCVPCMLAVPACLLACTHGTSDQAQHSVYCMR